MSFDLVQNLRLSSLITAVAGREPSRGRLVALEALFCPFWTFDPPPSLPALLASLIHPQSPPNDSASQPTRP